MPIAIHNKQYKTVAERVNEFRSDHADLTIETDILEIDSDKVLMKAFIKDGDKTIATGHAEEERAASRINKTSALENCETSAVGRALANFGLAGEEFASANEVSNAIIQQAVNEAVQRLISHNIAARENINSITAIKAALAMGEWSTAAEAFFELDEDTRKALGVATTKGGIWSKEDTNALESEEYKQARTQYFEDKNNG